MTTQEAINTIDLVINGLQSSIAGEEKQISAYIIARDQLKGLLDTPSADLAKAQADIATLSDAVVTKESEIESTKKELEREVMLKSSVIAEKEVLVATVATLEAEKDAVIAEKETLQAVVASKEDEQKRLEEVILTKDAEIASYQKPIEEPKPVEVVKEETPIALPQEEIIP